MELLQRNANRIKHANDKIRQVQKKIKDPDLNDYGYILWGTKEYLTARLVEMEEYRDKLVNQNNSLVTGSNTMPLVRIKTGDLMTIRGISILASIRGGSSEQVFEWNAIGTSNQPESAADKALVAEIDRVWMPVSGFVSPSSNSVTYEGIYSPSLPSATIYENGVFSDLDPVNSVMLLRTVFVSPLNHTQNVTIPVFSQIIYLKAI